VSALTRVLGQPYATRVLGSALKAGRPASAYLFFGPSGCGKKTAANALAQALFCELKTGEGCGDCSACRRVMGNKHPDYFVFAPQANSFKVEQVRDLLKEASMRPFEAPRRVMVLDKVELMSPEAANALLKVLEEPNASLVFVLVTTGRARILPTIASRCQALRFGPLPEKVLVGLLMDDKGLDEKTARSLAGLSGGSIRIAMRLSGEVGKEFKDLAEGFLEAAALRSQVALLNWAHLAAAEKKRLDEILELVSAYLRELWIEKSGLPKALKILSEPPIHGGGLSPKRLEELMLAVSRAQGQIKRNANLPLVLENMVLN
jgi:DNA polymerase III subunit delta'